MLGVIVQLACCACPTFGKRYKDGNSPLCSWEGWGHSGREDDDLWLSAACALYKSGVVYVWGIRWRERSGSSHHASGSPGVGSPQWMGRWASPASQPTEAWPECYKCPATHHRSHCSYAQDLKENLFWLKRCLTFLTWTLILNPNYGKRGCCLNPLSPCVCKTVIGDFILTWHFFLGTQTSMYFVIDVVGCLHCSMGGCLLLLWQHKGWKK